MSCKETHANSNTKYPHEKAKKVTERKEKSFANVRWSVAVSALSPEDGADDDGAEGTAADANARPPSSVSFAAVVAYTRSARAVS